MLAGLMHSPLRLAAVALAAGLIACLATAATSTLTVPHLTIGTQSNAVTAQELAPAACSGLTLTSVVLATSSALPDGTSNALILGTGNASDNFNSTSGSNDCCVEKAGVTPTYSGTNCNPLTTP